MTVLHPKTFDYLRPTPVQLDRMQTLRRCAAEYAHALEQLVPEGPDKTYMLRKLREVAMWANIAVTRHTDGAPRDERDELLPYPPDHPAPGDLGSVPL
jgi:hypothetical protein